MNRNPHLEIPHDIKKQIPVYGKTARPAEPIDMMLYASFSDGLNGSAYYVAEYDGADQCFGFVKVVNKANQMADFTLSAISGYRNAIGLPLSFDDDFVSQTARELMEHLERRKP